MIKITNKELIQELIGEIKDFPRYTTQLINLANQNAQGTRPRVVGQLSELINECPEKTYEGWKNWYLKKYPTAVKNATEKIDEMMNNLKGAINLIDKSMIKKWVEDLVLEKTFIGLKFQEAILKKVASIKNTTYKLANPREESRGIDGFVGDNPVSIKPTTYKTKKFLREEIKTKIIFYTKTKTGLEIDADEILK
jgi:hypothetical protein